MYNNIMPDLKGVAGQECESECGQGERMGHLPAKNISSFTFFAFAMTAPKPIPGKMNTLFACKQRCLLLEL